jgi:hypothetical protein
MDTSQLRRLTDAEKRAELIEVKDEPGEDINIVVVTDMTVRGENDVAYKVPAYPNAKFPDDYEVTHESQNSDGSTYRVWKMGSGAV